jgi:flagellar export protein FliJ
MAFRYPLQSILRLRRSLERQAEQRLFVLAGQVAALRTDLEELNRRELEQKLADLDEMASGSFGSALQFVELRHVAVSEKRKGIQMRLEAAERQRLEQLGVYRETRQKREIFERMRERQEYDYDLDVSRREQQRTDETFLLRRFYEEHE